MGVCQQLQAKKTPHTVGFHAKRKSTTNLSIGPGILRECMGVVYYFFFLSVSW
jgi:hypothetical protein